MGGGRFRTILNVLNFLVPIISLIPLVFGITLRITVFGDSNWRIFYREKY